MNVFSFPSADVMLILVSLSFSDVAISDAAFLEASADKSLRDMAFKNKELSSEESSDCVSLVGLDFFPPCDAPFLATCW